MTFLILKALHIIGVVTWFAGLFYIVRLFVYIAEAHERPAHERDVLLPQLLLMAHRLWFGITWPACVATVVFGGLLAPYFWPPPLWFAIKLGLVGVLLVYHLGCHIIHQRMAAGELVMTSRTLRIYNEGATLLLFSIVFVVVLKGALALAWAVAGFVVLSGALMGGITVYRRMRAQ